MHSEQTLQAAVPPAPAAHRAGAVAAVADARPTRRIARQAVLWALLAVVLVFVGRSLADRFAGIDWAAVRFDFGFLLVGVVVLAMHEILCGVTLLLSVRTFGQSVRLPAAAAAYCIASLGRYIPGKVATVAGLAALLTRFKLRTTAAIGSTLLHTGMSVLVGLLIALPSLLLAAGPEGTPAWTWAVGLPLAAVAGCCLHPRVFVRLANRVLRRAGRPTMDLPPGKHDWLMLATALATAARMCVLGLGVWLVIRSVAPIAVGHILLMISAAVAAMVLGLLAIFAPAGIGVREGIYIVLLTGPIGASAAALATVVIRLVQTALDVVLGLGGLALLRRVTPAPNFGDTILNSRSSQMTKGHAVDRI